MGKVFINIHTICKKQKYTVATCIASSDYIASSELSMVSTFKVTKSCEHLLEYIRVGMIVYTMVTAMER